MSNIKTPTSIDEILGSIIKGAILGDEHTTRTKTTIHPKWTDGKVSVTEAVDEIKAQIATFILETLGADDKQAELKFHGRKYDVLIRNELRAELRTKFKELLKREGESMSDIEKIIIEWHKKVTGQNDVNFLPDMQVQSLIDGLEALTSKKSIETLNKIKSPTIQDVFPSKPYDGTNTYEDMLQVVNYYEKTIGDIKAQLSLQEEQR